jgi:hypothetical protein
MVIVECHAPLPDDPFKFLALAHGPVRHRLPHQRPESRRRVQLRHVRGQGTERQPVRSTASTTRYAASMPRSCAKAASAASMAAMFTSGIVSQ